MKNEHTARTVFPILVLASAMTIPAVAQQTQPADNTSAAPAAAAQTSTSTPPPPPAATNSLPGDHEGFWGRVYPMARKKWIKKRLDPINDQLNELEQVNAKNAQDIKDVDSRAQAGIKKAQDTADGANQ